MELSWGNSPVGGEGYFNWKELFKEKFFVEEEISKEGEPDFLALLKNEKKFNIKKQVFFRLKVRSNIKTYNEQKLLRIWKGLPPPHQNLQWTEIIAYMKGVAPSSWPRSLR